MPIRKHMKIRRIDGWGYTLHDIYVWKKKVNEAKKRLKKAGWLVRVFSYSGPTEYVLYRRRKK